MILIDVKSGTFILYGHYASTYLTLLYLLSANMFSLHNLAGWINLYRIRIIWQSNSYKYKVLQPIQYKQNRYKKVALKMIRILYYLYFRPLKHSEVLRQSDLKSALNSLVLPFKILKSNCFLFFLKLIFII